jgi:hypothetical protein
VRGGLDEGPKKETSVNKKVATGMVALATVALLLGACAGAPSARGAGANATPAKKTYATSGRSIRMIEAMNQCTIAALKLAVADLIGPELAEKYNPELNQVLYNTQNPNAYIYTDESETTRKDKSGEEYIYERKVVVNMVAVQNTLKANNIGAGTGGGAAETAAKDNGSGSGTSKASTTTTATAETPKPAGPSAKDQEIIQRYVDKMTYLVYFNEASVQDAFAAKMAVGVANEYLVSNTMETIDLDQVQKLKKDQEKVYQEQSGQDMTLIQWLAQKLNADVYIEIDAKSTGETSGTGGSARYYGQANVSVKAYEASTGRLLGTQNWNSPKTTSLTSQDDAKLNAVQASVYKSMPVVIDQAKAYMAKAFLNGIKYELILQKTSDTKLVNDLRKKLQTRVKDIKTVSQSAEETKYDVWLIGSMDDLVDAVMSAKDTVSGLEGLELVMMRSKSATFDTGL